jgi:hypothetical protein
LSTWVEQLPHLVVAKPTKYALAQRAEPNWLHFICRKGYIAPIMKQLLLLLALCIVTGVAHAQTQSGNLYIGGTVGGNIQNYDGGYKTSSMSFKPAFGYFLNENWMAGLSTELKYTHTESYGTSQQRLIHYDNRSRAVSIGPMVRYYYSIGTSFSIFGEGAAGLTFVKNKQETEMEAYYSDPYNYHTGSNVSFNTKQLFAGFAPGIVFFPKPKFGIELKANILTYTRSLDSENNYSSWNLANPKTNFNANLSLATTTIGAGYYF